MAADKPKVPTRTELRRLRFKAKQRFNYAVKVERSYGMKLRHVARQINRLTHNMTEVEPTNHGSLYEALERYSHALRPWAQAVSGKMVSDIARHDGNAWRGLAASMGVSLRAEQLAGKDLDAAIREITEAQIVSITSMPLRVASSVQEMAVQGVFTGQRASAIRNKIRGLAGTTLAQANTIARTATSSAASATVQARARALGSESYVWRSAEDSDVRPLHKKLNGKRFRWDNPPVIGEDGKRGHPGEIYNCRCYPEPDLPD